jgi:hypothetical protein
MTATGSLVVRQAAAEDLAGILRLHAGRFGAAVDAELWRWKYERLPGLSRSVVAVVEGSAVVAHAGALGLEARSPKAEGLLWQLVDFVGTAHGGTLRSAMVEAGRALLAGIPRAQDLPWVFGFPGERHFQLGERSFGYRPVRRIPYLEGTIPERDDGSEVGISDSCDAWAEAAWEACAVSGVCRTTAFLNWRYHGRPDRYYRFYRLSSPSAAADGLLVFGFDGDVASAAEVWLPPGGEWRAGVLAVGQDLRRTGMRRWRFWAPAVAETAGLLRELGVAPSGADLFLGCGAGAAGSDSDPVAEAASIHYSIGDYDCT